MEQIINKTNQTDFISLFLEEKKPQLVDWIRRGRYFKSQINPPKLIDDVDCFADGLKEIIPDKLKQALKVQQLLKYYRRKRLNLIIENVPSDNQWFYLLLEAHLFSEYYLISKWITYWLNLWYQVTKSPKQYASKGKFTDSDIQKAKDYPIQDLYEGVLRKSGDKYCGLCPFHNEKHGSFFIFPNNSWHCFGACGEGGDSINFLMKLRNIDFIEAIKTLIYGHN